ncbi:MAG: HPr family phosphocarrier protein [Clostridia bacterium]|nr:HPr family phosphocarrier protein [Clostridia bacterium]
MSEARRTVTVTHESGLHARPAALFVQTAARFKADIKVAKGDRSANAKSIMSVLALGVTKGTTIDILATGDDAEEAVDALTRLVESGFGES